MNVTIKVKYENYEPNKGYEELQAKLQNDASKQYDEPFTTAEEIKRIYSADDFDNKTVLYAFDENNKLLTFSRVTVRPQAIFMMYPWKTEDCPSEVQGKVFDDLLAYGKELNTGGKPILIGAEKAWTEAIEFIESRNYTFRNETFRYMFKVDVLANIKLPEYKTGMATTNDLPAIIALIKKEPSFENFFESDDTAAEFFKPVIERDEMVLVYDNNELISAGATTGNVTDDGVMLQVTITDIKKMFGWKAVLVELAKIYQKKGYGDKNFIITPDLEEEQVKFYKEHNASVWSNFVTYTISESH